MPALSMDSAIRQEWRYDTGPLLGETTMKAYKMRIITVSTFMNLEHNDKPSVSPAFADVYFLSEANRCDYFIIKTNAQLCKLQKVLDHLVLHGKARVRTSFNYLLPNGVYYHTANYVRQENS